VQWSSAANRDRIRLFGSGLATFEEDRGAYNQPDAAGFIRLSALRMRTAARLRKRLRR